MNHVSSSSENKKKTPSTYPLQSHIIIWHKIMVILFWFPLLLPVWVCWGFFYDVVKDIHGCKVCRCRYRNMKTSKRYVVREGILWSSFTSLSSLRCWDCQKFLSPQSISWDVHLSNIVTQVVWAMESRIFLLPLSAVEMCRAL